MSDDDNKKVSELEKKVSQLRDDETRLVTEYADGQSKVKQLIDLALLGNGLLKGQDLSAFIRRSIKLL